MTDKRRRSVDEKERVGKAAPAMAAPQAWLAFPEVAPEASLQSALPAAQPATDLTLAIEVEPRKPRLAWQGMWRKEITTAVRTQVLEIVRPGRAVDRGTELAGLDTRQVTAREPTTTLPPNRLICVNAQAV